MKRVVSYKILDLINLYNFGTKFIFIQYHIKNYELFCVSPFVGGVTPSPTPTNRGHW